MAEHGPSDRRPIALRLEREFGRAGAGHRLHEIEFDPNESSVKNSVSGQFELGG